MDILTRKQKGGWYEYQIAIDGEKVGLKVPCETIQTMSDSAIEQLLDRNGRAIVKLPRDLERTSRC